MAIAEHAVNHPAWVADLVDGVMVEAVTPLAFIGALGYQYWPPGTPGGRADAWVVVVYPSPNEVRGQDANDGALSVSGFKLDVWKVVRAFAEVEAVTWHAPTNYTGNLDGPELAVLGTYAGHRAEVRFFHLPPKNEPAAYAVDPRTGYVTELPA